MSMHRPLFQKLAHTVVFVAICESLEFRLQETDPLPLSAENDCVTHHWIFLDWGMPLTLPDFSSLHRTMIRQVVPHCSWFTVHFNFDMFNSLKTQLQKGGVQVTVCKILLWQKCVHYYITYIVSKENI